MTTLVTDLFAERISEFELVRLHKSWLIIFPAKTSRLVDRGFAFCTIYYPNLNIAFVPAFMRGRSQMGPISSKIKLLTKGFYQFSGLAANLGIEGLSTNGPDFVQNKKH